MVEPCAGVRLNAGKQTGLDACIPLGKAGRSFGFLKLDTTRCVGVFASVRRPEAALMPISFGSLYFLKVLLLTPFGMSILDLGWVIDAWRPSGGVSCVTVTKVKNMSCIQ